MKKIWEYRANDDSFFAEVFEKEPGILVGKGKGIQDKKSIEAFNKFIFSYKKKGDKITYITDNTETKSISTDARKLLLEHFDKSKSPFKLLITVGNNIFIRGIIKLYSAIVPKKVKLNAFKNIDEALKWVKKQ